MKAIAWDLGHDYNCEIGCDAPAAIAAVRRKGVGRMRHVSVADFWVQEQVAKKKMILRKISTEDKRADILTNHVKKDTVMKHLENMGFGIRWSREVGLQVQYGWNQPGQAGSKEGCKHNVPGRSGG